MDPVTTAVIKSLVLPPGLNLILILLAIFLFRIWKRFAIALLGVAVISLYVFSMPLISNFLLADLERFPALLPQDLPHPGVQAIVVLGGGRYPGAPEYGNDSVSSASLRRIRYAARLYRHTRLPIVLSGGRPMKENLSEARIMKTVLVEDFHIPVQWIEEESRNTAENASYTQALLSRLAIRHVYVVTDAWHMPRAVEIFKSKGFDVVPAPTGFSTLSNRNRLLDTLPSADALLQTRIALHEYLGRWWYRLRY